MKGIFTLLFLFCLTISFSQTSLTIHDPTRWNQPQIETGVIQNLEVDIKLDKLFAEFEITFDIKSNYYWNSLDAEARMEFELPEEAFIHNSWLWLEDGTIINAELIERGEATQTYNDIVYVIRTDPSLLTKNNACSYHMKVFPIRNNFPRKIRLQYALPVNWVDNKVTFPLDLEDFFGLTTDHAIISIQSNSDFKDGKLVHFDNPLHSSLGANTVLKRYVYPASELSKLTNSMVEYETNNLESMVYASGLSDNVGTYQLVINPRQQSSINNYVVVVDTENKTGSLKTALINDQLKKSIYKNFNSNDRLHFISTNNINPRNTFAGNWIDPSNPNFISDINQALAVSSSNSIDNLLDALVLADDFAHTSGDDFEVIIISNRYETVNTNNVLQKLNNFNNKLNVPWSFKTHYINCSSRNPIDYAIQDFLVYSTNGTLLHTYRTPTYLAKSISIPKFCVQTAVTQLVSQTKQSDSYLLYDNNGVKYNNHFEVNKANYNSSQSYVEVGEYNGNINIDSLFIFSIKDGVPSHHGFKVNVKHSNPTVLRDWTDIFIKSKPNLTNNAVTDLSIQNDVLCELTAYLALETGDTVGAGNSNGQSNGGISDIDNISEALTLDVYPNPFKNYLTITTSNLGIYLVEIYDLNGRKIFSQEVDKNESEIVIRDEILQNLNSGIYFLISTSEDEQYLNKIQKI